MFTSDTANLYNDGNFNLFNYNTVKPGHTSNTNKIVFLCCIYSKNSLPLKVIYISLSQKGTNFEIKTADKTFNPQLRQLMKVPVLMVLRLNSDYNI